MNNMHDVYCCTLQAHTQKKQTEAHPSHKTHRVVVEAVVLLIVLLIVLLTEDPGRAAPPLVVPALALLPAVALGVLVVVLVLALQVLRARLLQYLVPL